MAGVAEPTEDNDRSSGANGTQRGVPQKIAQRQNRWRLTGQDRQPVGDLAQATSVGRHDQIGAGRGQQAGFAGAEGRRKIAVAERPQAAAAAADVRFVRLQEYQAGDLDRKSVV